MNRNSSNSNGWWCTELFTRSKSRWHTFACVLLAASSAGTSYAFGIFSQVLRSRLSLSQADLSIISSCGSSGLYTQVITGQLIERYGPHSVLYLGALLVFAGNVWIWLATQKQLPHSVPVLSLIWFLAQVGIACASSTCLVVSLRVFPNNVRGRIAGISKAYFGISSAILASVASGFFGESSVDFILFVAIALPLVLLFAGFNTNFLPDEMISFEFERSRGWPTRLSPFIAHLLLLFAAILAIGATGVVITLSRSTRMILGSVVAVVMFSVLLLPSYYGPRFMQPQLSKNTSATTTTTAAAAAEGGDNAAVEDHESVRAPLLTAADTVEASTTTATATTTATEAAQKKGQDGDDTTATATAAMNKMISFYGRHVPLSEVIRDWRLYALMCVFVVIAGSGLLVINNIQAVAAAVNQRPSNFFVTVVSLANAVGRLTTGIFSDAVRKRGITRLQILTATAVSMAAAQFLLSQGQSDLLYVCLLIVGFMFGSAFSNVSAIVADLWGSKFVGSNYGFVDMSPIIGSYVFSTGLIAALYRPNSNNDDDDDDGDEDSCVGKRCFQMIFIVTTVCGVAAAMLCYVLHFYTPIRPQL